MKNRLCICIFAVQFIAVVPFIQLWADLPANWPADYPAWWYNPSDPASGVINATVTPLNQKNLSPLSQGQLWNLAAQGIAELNRSLAPIGGAGFTLDAFRETDEPPTFLAVANLGQLKNVSSKFFDRLTEVGFQPGESGWPTGLNLDPLTAYPWANNQTPNNLAPVNLGQAKHLFSWHVRTWITDAMQSDTDSDGLPDFWESYWGTIAMTADGDPDGDGLSNALEYLGATDPLNTEDLDPVLQPILRADASLVIHLEGTGYYRVHENSQSTPLHPLGN